MIVGSRTANLEIPHEKGNFIEIRELSGPELDNAQDIKSDKVMKKYGSIGAEALASLRSTNGAEPIAQPELDPKDEYDKEYCITNAIVNWSGTNYDNIPCNNENKLKLDKTTFDWIFAEIIKRNTLTEGESVTFGG